jgi:ADP-ribosylglycohydrolase
MAAAVAEAMKAEASVESVVASAVAAIIQLSGQEMRERVERAVGLAREVNDYKGFREAVYADRDRFFCRITCDSRETIPLTLALLVLAAGDLEHSVTFAANLGRDADTIATMCGAVAGALSGVGGIRPDWVARAQSVTGVDQREMASKLAHVALRKHQREMDAHALLERLL